MKLKFFIFIAFIFSTFQASAQLPTIDAVKDTFAGIKKQFDSVITTDFSFSCNGIRGKEGSKQFISTPAFTKLSEKYFALAITDKDKTPIGSFASLDFGSNDTRLNLSLTTDIKPRSYLTISTSLSVKDKTGSIFSNNKINSGFSVFKYSFLILSSDDVFLYSTCSSSLSQFSL